MSLILKINTVDCSSSIKWDTLSWTSVLTKEVDRLQFQVVKTSTKTIPETGDLIELLEGSDKIFGGTVIERTEVIRGGLLLGYEIKCKDHSHTLDRILVTKNYEGQLASDIILDIVSEFTDGTFTTANVTLDTPEIGSIRFNYEQVTRCLSQLAQQLGGWDWYVDANKDIHFFAKDTVSAAFNLDDTTGNFEFASLEVNESVVQLKNDIIIRGGEYKKTFLEAAAVDLYIGDGSRTTFQLAYRYENINIKKNAVVQSVGVDQITDPLTVDVLYNFQEKFIKFPAAVTNGHVVKVYGDALIPIIAQVRDQDSIAAYGQFQALVVDKSIGSIDEAQTRGKAELEKYAAGVFDATFKTVTPGLRVGQTITITSVIRDIAKTFRINRINARADRSDRLKYDIQLLDAGETTFIDIMIELLGKDAKNIVIATNEVIQRLENFTESIVFGEDVTATTTSPPYKWASSSNDLIWGFGTWS